MIKLSVHVVGGVDFDLADASEASESDDGDVRIHRLLRFGHWLAEWAPETGFRLVDGLFSVDVTDAAEVADAAEAAEASTAAVERNKDTMMRNMATLWLKSEVQDLEDRLDGPSFPLGNGPKLRGQGESACETQSNPPTP